MSAQTAPFARLTNYVRLFHMNTSPNFHGKTAIVTGGASGMGGATARLLAQAGANVVIVDMNTALATQVAEQIGAGAPVIGSVADSAFCRQAVQTAVARHGRLDVVVNAAGTILRADAETTSDDEWRRVMSVNCDGVFFMCRAAVQQMKQQAPDANNARGAIVNFGSIWAELGGKGHVAYCASKGAVLQITRAMALDHARDGIRINAVCPGEVDTPMLRGGGRAAPIDDARIQAIGETLPIGRVAQPEELARAVLFLASEQASYMVGAVVYVDGGYSAV